MGKIKWYTVQEYVDTDTGDVMNKSEYERGNYIITKKTIKREINEKHGITKITNECGRNRQLSIF